MEIGLINLVHEDLHPAPPGHPENPVRMKAALKVLESSDIVDWIDYLEPGEVDVSVLYDVHNKSYVEEVRELCQKGGGFLDSDTYAGKRSFGAAMKVVSASVWAVDLLFENRYKRIFLAGRPPGHHAEKNRGMGFCLFNNAAVAAEYMIKKHNLKRVAIVDWDVHHGNGTQQIFYDRDNVMFISLHQYPFYPGSGAESEIGINVGEGYTLNIPMASGSSDKEYIGAFDDKILPALNEFRPEAIVISSGFDASREDPLASINLSSETYGVMTRKICGLSDKYCEGRILSLFEGGYEPIANAHALYAHLKEMMKE